MGAVASKTNKNKQTLHRTGKETVHRKFWTRGLEVL
jgi:hypothetical protein